MSRKKVILSTITLLFVMFVAVFVVSYSIATKGHGDSNSEKIAQTDVTNMAASSIGGEYISNIDLIIENAANNGETFNIVEIVPDGTGASALETYVDNEGFSQYVISANKTDAAGPDMPADMVNYQLLSVNSATSLTDAYGDGTVQELLDAADLIYFSSPGYASYDGVLNINDELYNYMQNYATTYKKPLVMDYVTSTSGTVSDDTLYKDLVDAIKRNHIRFRTFGWKENVTAANFFSARDSYYISYPVNELSSRAPGTVLVITTSGATAADTMYSRMRAMDEATLINTAYYGLNNRKPTAMTYEVWNLTNGALTAAELDKNYDFILIENDAKDAVISNDVYNKLLSLSESSKYILYDARITETEAGGEIVVTKNNYLKLLHLLVSETGVSNYSNVLPVSRNFFKNLNNMGDSGLTEARKVADLLDSAVYRDSATTGANGNKFRVLEIQPCYPIDLEIAESNAKTTMYDSNRTSIKGGYYTKPDQVLYGVTKDEIPEGAEYYAFDISKAKISKATGIPYNQIEIDQMSANQLISTKSVVMENYDLVYIGGDTSAFVPNFDINYGGNSGYTWQNPNGNDYHGGAKKAFTAFDMYTHTGTFVDYHLSYYSVAGGTNSVTTNGNDLSTIKRDELIDYVKAGLPVLIDEVVSTAFEKTYAFDAKNKYSTETPNRFEQLALHDIDPDSNMYQFLAYAYNESKEGSTTVGWGSINTNNDETQVDNSDLALGQTIGPMVTVYNEGSSNAIKSLVVAGATRPALVVSEFPINYIEGNSKTTNTSKTVSFSGSVMADDTTAANVTYDVVLYVDANGDGMYLDGEIMDETTCSPGGNYELSYDLDDEFFGLVNWKIKATVSGGVLCDTVTGNAFFKVDPEMKKTVRVLQIMPFKSEAKTQDTSSLLIGDYSLYFCTECQQSSKIIKNNVTVNGFDHAVQANGKTYQDPGQNSYKDIATVWSNKVNVGLHEHDFGIVIYDSTTSNLDDWESNYADSLTHGESGTEEDGDYEFDLDIMTNYEFDNLCDDAAERTEEQVEAATVLANDCLTQYEAAMNSSELVTLGAVLEKELYAAVADLDANYNGRFKDVIVKGIGSADAPGDWMLDKEYYKFWEYYNDSCVTYNVNNFDALAKAYNDYIEKYDEAVELKNQYRMNLRQTGDADTWLLNNYDVIVIGLADQFNQQDLNDNACAQLKTYIDEGGSILNSHDSLTGESSKGSVKLTNTLRESFGMDRFHVVDYSESKMVNVSVEMNYTVASTKEVKFGIKGQFGDNWGGLTVPISNRDVVINVKDEWGGGLSYTYGAVEKGVGEDIKVTFTGTVCSQGDLVYLDPTEQIVPVTGGSYESITISAPVARETEISTGSFQLGESNVNATMSTVQGERGTFTASEVTTEVAADGTLQLDITVLSDGNPVPSGINVTCEYRGNELTAQTDDNGVATFVIDPAMQATTSIFDTPTGVKYRRYDTEDNSKYFWTERLQAASEKDYASVISTYSVGSFVKYNAPIGITDMYATYDTTQIGLGPYRYVYTAPESFEHASDVDGVNYEAKYGTRKAEQVNKGGVTFFPFVISEELMISPTHSQVFALDIEDPTIAVWYTLSANYVDEKLSVSPQFARYSSSFFAASPKDGMNNYFLYSKDNVFYTGAGHQRVTGRNKNNNDERRLFINVIVNCVTKGTVSPSLKLYNECTENGSEHVHCECQYVDPKDDESNETLSRDVDTLFFNKAIDMYQYNVDDSQAVIYPEFDFKAIAGTANIKSVEVFYDLNYGEGDGMDSSDAYVDDEDHVLITSYDKNDDVSGKRNKLRQATFPDTLILKDEYFDNYNNYTYIVIRVKDDKNKTKTARVKINVIPHLFDLTDATSDSQTLSYHTPLVDKTDRLKYNI